MASRKKKFRETVSSNMGSSLLEFEYPAYTVPPAVPEPADEAEPGTEPSTSGPARSGPTRSATRRPTADRPALPREADPA